MSYDSYQAEQGEAACLSVLASDDRRPTPWQYTQSGPNVSTGPNVPMCTPYDTVIRYRGCVLRHARHGEAR